MASFSGLITYFFWLIKNKEESNKILQNDRYNLPVEKA